jgi:phospholipid/cholesterol/gamma-HCH transport system ATP-binding protein
MNRIMELREVSLFREGRAILNNVSLELVEKECTVIMGASGSGASIFLKTAAGIINPDKGKVLAWGQDVQAMSAQEQFVFRSKMGFVFQDAALWANMSGFQNIALPFQYHRRRMSQEEIAGCIGEMLREFDFTTSIERRPVGFSTGERKVISFIRAMILEPELLFVDDPTASIDNVYAKRILGILKNRKDRGCTLFIATNDPAYILRLADNLVILREGNIEEAGTFSQVRASHNPYVREILSENLSLPG